MSDYPTLDDVPDDWIPLSEHSEDSNINGETFIKPKNMGFELIRYHANKENESMTFFDVEAKQLIARLGEYQHDKFRKRRNRQ